MFRKKIDEAKKVWLYLIRQKGKDLGIHHSDHQYTDGETLQKILENDIAGSYEALLLGYQTFVKVEAKVHYLVGKKDIYEGEKDEERKKVPTSDEV